MEEVKNIRLFFFKKDRAKYISHLDLNRTIGRAIRRAELPFWTTQGFNPHIHITFALPLSLGIEGERESFDVKLIKDVPFDEIMNTLNDVLPHDIKITSIDMQKMPPTAITKAVYEIEYEGHAELLREFLNRESITVDKNSKKGIIQIDLKPYIDIKAFDNNKLVICLPAGSTLNINPTLITDNFEAQYKVKFNKLLIKRVNILCNDDSIFC